jgi:hypothetical protein
LEPVLKGGFSTSGSTKRIRGRANHKTLMQRAKQTKDINIIYDSNIIN